MLKTSLLIALIMNITLLTFGVGRAYAQGVPDIDVSLSANNSQPLIGQPFTLSLQVVHPQDHQVIIPILSQTWGDLEVRRQSNVSMAVNGNGTATTSQTIGAALFSIGESEIPELTITVVDSSGEITRTTTPVVAINVLPTVTDVNVELRENRPQASIPPQSPLPLILGASAAGAVVLGLLGWGVYLFMKRMYWLPGMTKPVIDTRTPYEIARDDLAHIESLNLPAQGKSKEHYDMVADALRRYIEAAFRVDLTGVTTNELDSALVNTAMRTDDTHRVISFLKECDEIKYARIEIGADMMRRDTNRAHDLIDLLSPTAPTAVAAGV